MLCWRHALVPHAGATCLFFLRLPACSFASHVFVMEPIPDKSVEEQARHICTRCCKSLFF